MKLYQAIARKLQAIQNPQTRPQWREIHKGELAAWVHDHLPSGSGFDNGTSVDDSSTPDRLVFNTAFHHMDDNGFYCGWTDHQVIVTPSLWCGFHVRVTGRDKRGIKGYIAEVFNSALDDIDVDCF